VAGLETVLAERVALCAWRLRRVAAYETAVTALGMGEADPAPRKAGTVLGAVLALSQKSDHDLLAEAEQELQELWPQLAGWDRPLNILERLAGMPREEPLAGQDVCEVLQVLLDAGYEFDADADLPDTEAPKFLRRLGVPRNEVCDAYEWTGWTAGMVQTAWKQVAAAAGVPPDGLLTRAIEIGRKHPSEWQERITQLEKDTRRLRKRINLRRTRERQRRMLPDEGTLNKVSRYEAHLSRQMFQALHTLERLQAARVGLVVPPPAVLEVTVGAAGAVVDYAGVSQPVPALGYAEGA
jgi:hypothetical protein